MVTGRLAPQTWLHRVPAGVKLVGLALLRVLLLPVDDWRILAGVLAVIDMIYAGVGRAGMTRLNLLRPLLPLLVVVGACRPHRVLGMPAPSSACGYQCCGGLNTIPTSPSQALNCNTLSSLFAPAGLTPAFGGNPARSDGAS